MRVINDQHLTLEDNTGGRASDVRPSIGTVVESRQITRRRGFVVGRLEPLQPIDKRITIASVVNTHQPLCTVRTSLLQFWEIGDVYVNSDDVSSTVKLMMMMGVL